MKITTLNGIQETGVSHNHKIKKRVMVNNNEIKHITNFSQAIFPPGECAATHSHPDMTEVFFVQSGEGEFKINEKTFPLIAGTCITIDTGDTHELTNTGADDLVVMYFGVLDT